MGSPSRAFLFLNSLQQVPGPAGPVMASNKTVPARDRRLDQSESALHIDMRHSSSAAGLFAAMAMAMVMG